MRRDVFSLTVFPLLWTASWFGARPEVFLWERVRPLRPFPAGYQESYSNVQAAIGLAGLDELAEWTAATRRHAAFLTSTLEGVAGVSPPPTPPDRVHAYYQYSVYVFNREQAVTGCLRRGLDVESQHMDVCPELPLFGAERSGRVPGARRTTQAIQLPVHASLSASDLHHVAQRARAAFTLQLASEPRRSARGAE
jgi:dTDP-4-amino-4,6-dideoxygalactose transaminase